ncbi:MAG TPA: beta-propeller fold lactonase family protein, partial [Solirubrobacteraceae bacterium]|nr:beta-propeller fold lactonase family protein [Solirubrobacteraceae bacterium]
PKVTGHVYTETNGIPKNAVVAFAQYSDGSLKQVQTIGTGGKGGNQAQPETGACLPPPAGQGNCPNLDTQGEVETGLGGKVVFAVNAGSNTVTSFRVTPGGLVKASVAKSGGVFPLSVTSHGNLLYALNANSANIQGFKVSSAGVLTPIKGSNQKLAQNVFPGLSRDIAFDNSGKWLVVSKFGNPFAPGGPSPQNSMDTFKVGASGAAGPAITSNATVPLPFSINFDSADNLILTEVGNPTATGFVDTFKLLPSGHLSPIQSAPTSSAGNAPCWGQITKKGYLYVTNADALGPNGATVAIFKVSGGHLTFKGTTPQIHETLKTDEALSTDQKYLYVLAPTSNRAPGGSHIDEYQILPNGGLKLIGQTPKTLAKSVNGLAAN